MTDTQQQKQVKKKQFRFFDTYIGKLLKQINSEKGITANTRQQLNSVLQFVTEILANKAQDITLKTQKRTISDAEVLTAARLELDGQFLSDIEARAQEAHAARDGRRHARRVPGHGAVRKGEPCALLGP